MHNAALLHHASEHIQTCYSFEGAIAKWYLNSFDLECFLLKKIFGTVRTAASLKALLSL